MSTENKTKLNESLLAAFNRVVNSESNNLFAEAKKLNEISDTEIMNSDLYKNALKGVKDPKKIQIGQDVEGLGKFEKGDTIFSRVKSELAAKKASQTAAADTTSTPEATDNTTTSTPKTTTPGGGVGVIGNSPQTQAQKYADNVARVKAVKNVVGEPETSRNATDYSSAAVVGNMGTNTQGVESATQIAAEREAARLRKIKMNESTKIKKKMDPVGKEDEDIDNDGDKDKTDSYLRNRRKAIAKSMKEESSNIFTAEELEYFKSIEEQENNPKPIKSSIVTSDNKYLNINKLKRKDYIPGLMGAMAAELGLDTAAGVAAAIKEAEELEYATIEEQETNLKPITPSIVASGKNKSISLDINKLRRKDYFPRLMGAMAAELGLDTTAGVAAAIKEAIAPTPKKYAPNGSDKTNSTGSKSGTLSDSKEEFKEIVSEELKHKVKKGQTLSALSKEYGVSVDDIAKASGIKDPNKLKIGQELTIPKAQTATQGATFKKTPADSLQYGELLPGKKERTSNQTIQNVAPFSYTDSSGDRLVSRPGFRPSFDVKQLVPGATPAGGLSTPFPLPRDARPGSKPAAPEGKSSIPFPLPRDARPGSKPAAPTAPFEAPVYNPASPPAPTQSTELKTRTVKTMPIGTDGKPLNSIQADQNAAYADRIAAADADEANQRRIKADQNAAYADRIADAGADEAKRMAAARKVNVNDPKAFNLPIENPLANFDLSKWGKERMKKVNEQINEARGRPPKEASLGANELHMNAKRAADNMANITHKFANGERVKMTKGMGVAFLNRHSAAKTADDKDNLLNYAHQSPETFENVARGGSVPKAEKVGIKLGSMKTK